MAKALRMFELISKMIEKQSEMASKAIAAIK
jgi:flagellar basal body rod protein FlgG